MRVYFGKELRQPIHDAFKAICDYFNNAFDIAATTKSNYESNVESNMCRNHTLYAMTDEKTEEYDGRHYICNMLDGAYLGSTELQNGILEGKILFEKTETPEPSYDWDETKIGVMILGENDSLTDQVTYYTTFSDVASYVYQDNTKRYYVHEGSQMSPKPSLDSFAFEGSTVVFVDFNDRTELPESLFDGEYGGCTIKRVRGIDNLVSIGNNAFHLCSDLEEFTFASTVRTIDYAAFDMCASLTEVTLPEGFTTLESGVFSGCSSLASVSLPSTLTSIGYGAFSECESLTTITIPSSVTSIGDRAFYLCENLTSITINKPQNSISGAPWGATNATVTWTG